MNMFKRTVGRLLCCFLKHRPILTLDEEFLASGSNWCCKRCGVELDKLDKASPVNSLEDK